MMAVILGIIYSLFRLGFWLFRARKYVGQVVMALVAINGLGWILYALGYDIINVLFGGGAIATFAYLILGAANLYRASRFYLGYHKRKGITLALVLMILVILSGVCWILMAFRYNLVAHLAGASTLATAIYLILGLAPISWLVVLSRTGHPSKVYW
jgi:uncharacterized membrane protein YuzA (DUF378 family)